VSISFSASDNGFTHVCGHRGYSLHYPENTILAFEETRKAGGTTCEIDVLLTRDDEIIVMHDMTLDRTTNGHGFVGDYDWSDLKGLDAGSYKSPRFAGTPIPTLAETLDWAKRTGMGLNIEMKDAERPELLATRILEVLEENDAFGHALVISFNHVHLAQLKERDSRVRTEAITHARHADIVAVMKSCGADSVSIELSQFEPEDAIALHEAGLVNRLHLPLPAKLMTYWAHGRDVRPMIGEWLGRGLVDSLSGDDVAFLRKLASQYPVASA
jgi:glycerophosphoryl diester phosphodiesterase